MNKKLVTLAVGAALGLGSAVAQAKVTVYGHAQVEIGNQEVTGNAGGIVYNDRNFTSDEARGRLGVMSAERLGNGMTALAKFEWLIDTTVGGLGQKQREAFVGLKGNFGTIELGNLKSPYKYWGGVSYDPFVTTTLEARNHGGMSGCTWAYGGPAGNVCSGVTPPVNSGDTSFGHHSFVENSIGWKSPNWNGFQLWGTYSFDEQDDATTSGKPVADGDWTAGVRYKNGPFEIGVAGFKNSSTLIPNSNAYIESNAWKVFGQYKWGNHTFSGQYESIKSDAGAITGDYETDVWFIGYQLRSGNNTFVAQVGKTEVDYGTGVAQLDVDYYAIGMIHHLSKKTRLFGGYSNSEVSQGALGAERDVWTVGMRVIF